MANNREILKRMKRGKYGNLKFNGFDSKKEAQFAADLESLKAAVNDDVRVVSVERQVRFCLIPAQRGADGKIIERKCDYLADFMVTRASGKVDVIDVKGYKTPEYIIKRKLMLHVHGIRVIEV